MRNLIQICVLAGVFVVLIVNSVESVRNGLSWRNISRVLPVSAEAEYFGKEVPEQAVFTGGAEAGKVFYRIKMNVQNKLARDNPNYSVDNIMISFEYYDGATALWDQTSPIYDVETANQYYPERQRERLIPAGREAEVTFFVQVPEQAEELSVISDFWQADPAFFSMTEESESESVLEIPLLGAAG